MQGQSKLSEWARSQRNDEYEGLESDEDEYDVPQNTNKKARSTADARPMAQSIEQSSFSRNSIGMVFFNYNDSSFSSLKYNCIGAKDYDKVTPYVDSHQFLSKEQKAIYVAHHLVQKSSEKDVVSELKSALEEISQNSLKVKQALKRLSIKCLTKLYEHSLLLISMQQKIKEMVTKNNKYQKTRIFNFSYIFHLVYKSMGEQVNFQRIKYLLIYITHKCYRQEYGSFFLNSFVEDLVEGTKNAYFHQLYEMRRKKRKNMYYNRDQSFGSSMPVGSWRTTDCNPRSTNFDGVSKYGLFHNDYEEKGRNKDGICMYRLERTIDFLDVNDVMDPSISLQCAKDYATFLIKLTDLHVSKLAKQTGEKCLLTLQNKVSQDFSGIWDQISFFQDSSSSKEESIEKDKKGVIEQKQKKNIDIVEVDEEKQCESSKERWKNVETSKIKRQDKKAEVQRKYQELMEEYESLSSDDEEQSDKASKQKQNIQSNKLYQERKEQEIIPQIIEEKDEETEPIVYRCVYPKSLLTIYNELRFAQLQKQKQLHQQLYPQIYKTLSHTQYRASKTQNMINSYFKSSQIPKQVQGQHKFYRPFNPPFESKCKAEIDHYRSVIEEQKAYANSELLLRLRTIY